MPAAKRRTSAGPTASKAKKSQQQSTLAFHGSNAKVSKPSAKAPSSKEKALESLLKPETTELTDGGDSLPNAPTSADISLVEQVVQDAKAPLMPEEEEASAMSDKQIERYWKEKEEGRKFPRLHQRELPLYERICRDFDTDSRFGPCVGMPRINRWKRAQRLRLNPPMEVLSVLLKEQEEGNVKAQRAHIDALLNSRFEDVI
ncbi:hypothetical protein EJ08DRAFT_651088 [Tothia fuscella]|uniref:DNA polymerase delta subunit 4 n=1 Tax=Tothia fuscella TaxID=1048955 RepID=A0A9P4NN25_9PEZI|nr:hypothetical protein EJ08DRAFT_651088 [Tothia fuscella]